MKNSKKLLSIILCIIVIASATVTSFVASAQSVPAFDETKPYVKATSIPVYPGEKATLTFEIGNNESTATHKGFWAMRHTLSFDNSVLSFAEGVSNEYGKFPAFTVGSNFENTLISPIEDKGEFVFLYTNSLGNIVNNVKNGVLFTIDFVVSPDAQPGTYYFEYIDYKDSNVIDIAENSVAFTYNQPSITVLSEETEPSSTEPSSTEPSSTEPSSTEPSSTEPSSTEPSSTEPSSTEPSSTEPSSTEPSSTESSSTEPSSTEPSSTEPSSTEPSSTEPTSSTGSNDPSGDDNFPTVTDPTESTSATKPSQTTQKVELGAIGSISVKVSGKNKVEITCPKVANAKSYEVYRANYGSKSFVRLGKVSKSPFVDNTVKGGKKYVYKVRAINGDVYKDSKQSKAVSIMNFKAKAKFKATPAKKNMTVKITRKIKYANGYQVAYSTNAKFKKKLTKTVTFKTKKTIKKLKSGTKYYVRVRAYKTIKGKKVYGSWTAKKSIKVK